MDTVLRLCIVALSASSVAAPLRVAADAPPLRHLEYSVSAHPAGIQSRDYEGRLDVDVLALAKDGGIVVRIAMTAEGSLRPGPAATCAVYGNSKVICPEGAAVNGTEDILLPLLGRNFYDPTKIDGDGKWVNVDNGGSAPVEYRFAAKPEQDPSVVAIHEQTGVSTGQPNDRFGFSSDADIRYSVAMSVPLSVHETTKYNSGGTDTTDLRLTKDSFTTH